MFLLKKIIFYILFSIILLHHIYSSDYSMIDSWAINTPNNFSDIGSLTAYLSNNNTYSDKDKARSFYMWIANNISIDIKAMTSFKESETDPQIVFSSKKSLARGYAGLFKHMCEQSGVKCEVIEGYYKDNLYYPGKKFSSPNHTWNAVLLDNQWYLVDASLASGKIGRKSPFLNTFIAKFTGKEAIQSEVYFEKKIVDNFFLVPPEQFAQTHLPVDPIWQLVDNPIDLSAFRLDSAEIAGHFKNHKPETAFNFHDSIKSYLSSPAEKQHIMLASHAEQYNPINYLTPAEIYSSLGAALYNETKINSNLKKSEKISHYKSANKHLKKAQGYYKSESSQIKTTNSEIKNWQRQENKNRIKFYKTAIKENEKLISKNKDDLEKIGNRKKDINNKINVVHYDTYPFSNDESIVWIERPEFFLSQEDSIKVKELYKMHRLNYDTVAISVKKIDSICNVSNDDLHFAVKIDRSMVSDSTFANIKQLGQLVETISLFDNQHYASLKKGHWTVKERRENIVTMRDTINAVEKRGFKNNYAVIKDYRRKVKDLAKENKSILKQIKKINANDSYEDQQFAEENDNYLRLSYMIIDRYFQEITEIKREAPILKNQNKLLAQEIKMLKSAIKTETARYKKDAELENNRYQSERNANKTNYKKVSGLAKLSEKEIAKLRKS